MKAITITIGVILLSDLMHKSYGQGFYIETNSSYNFALGSQVLYSNTESYSSYNSITYEDYDSDEEEQVSGTYGKGFQFGLGVGYMFTPSIGFELKAEHQLSGTYTSNHKGQSSITNPYESDTYYYSYDRTYKASMTKIIPSIIFQIPGTLVSPYAQVGAIFGLGKMTSTWSYKTDGFTQQGALVMDGGLAIGVNGEIGANFKLAERISLNTGLTFSALSYAPKKGEVTEYSIDDVDKLSELTTHEREVEYTDYVKTSSSDYDDPDEPYTAVKEWFPFSSVGLNIGIKISL